MPRHRESPNWIPPKPSAHMVVFHMVHIPVPSSDYNAQCQSRNLLTFLCSLKLLLRYQCADYLTFVYTLLRYILRAVRSALAPLAI